MLMWPWPDGDPFSSRARHGSADVRLAIHVAQRLHDGYLTNGARIDVSARDGVVILAGEVPDEMVRRQAGVIARETAGVRDVCNTLKAGGDPVTDRQFDQIVAGLTVRPRRRVWPAVLVAGVAWALLSVALVMLS